MIGNAIGALSLLGLAGVMMDSHLRTWHKVSQSPQTTDGQRRFARSQFSRRMQASGLIGMCGALIAIWPIVPRSPWGLGIYMGLLTGSTLLVLMMGFFDAWASSVYFRQLQSKRRGERLSLEAELEKAKKSLAEKSCSESRNSTDN